MVRHDAIGSANQTSPEALVASSALAGAVVYGALRQASALSMEFFPIPRQTTAETEPCEGARHDEVATGIGDDVTLSALVSLTCTEPGKRRIFRDFSTLFVDHARCRLRIASCREARRHDQRDLRSVSQPNRITTC